MSVQKVREALRVYGLEERVMEFAQSSATVELAAEAVGTQPAHIVKTLSFADQTGEKCILIACAGDAKVSSSLFKKHFGFKAKMLPADKALELTGHAVGGVCPFALPGEGVTVCLDKSIRRFDTVYPAAGSASSAVRLSPDELETACPGAAWVEICTYEQGD